MKNILYIITNISMPDICKVGITNNIDQRLKDLNKTGLPTRFQVYETFTHPHVELLEQKILQYFGEYRINRKREFIKIHPEKICDYINDHKHITPETDQDTHGKFAKLGLPVGSVLYFKEGDQLFDNIIATIGPGNSIIYDGKKSSLSKSAKIILKQYFDKDWKAVQGTIYWTYQGKSIRHLMDETII